MSWTVQPTIFEHQVSKIRDSSTWRQGRGESKTDRGESTKPRAKTNTRQEKRAVRHLRTLITNSMSKEGGFFQKRNGGETPKKGKRGEKHSGKSVRRRDKGGD